MSIDIPPRKWLNSLLIISLTFAIYAKTVNLQPIHVVEDEGAEEEKEAEMMEYAPQFRKPNARNSTHSTFSSTSNVFNKLVSKQIDFI
ncbi:uncharacterized protein LOC111686237 [Lucilia cuprina]|uniref:uncharacterized protein LOC111686237 n=1 Tax=Lucilia cuprina TaxID=7375 RepID=UPI001F05F5C6|nr:uncharacterized protein LOC111686237 [Lucilia cuprina]